MDRAERPATSLPPPRLRAAEIALFLDVDGTLLEIEREPGAVHVPERLCRILEQLQSATGGALALVSGRSLDQLDRLFSPLRFSAAGLHGLERRNLDRKTERATPDPELFETAVAESEGAFALLQGKMVYELKPPGIDKGRAIATFLDEPPFAGRPAVFAGDDVTDEAGFEAINRQGGVSIRIGDGRPTAAAYGCPNVAALQTWLLQLLGSEAS